MLLSDAWHHTSYSAPRVAKSRHQDGVLINDRLGRIKRCWFLSMRKLKTKCQCENEEWKVITTTTITGQKTKKQNSKSEAKGSKKKDRKTGKTDWNQLESKRGGKILKVMAWMGPIWHTASESESEKKSLLVSPIKGIRKQRLLSTGLLFLTSFLLLVKWLYFPSFAWLFHCSMLFHVCHSDFSYFYSLILYLFYLKTCRSFF